MVKMEGWWKGGSGKIVKGWWNGGKVEIGKGVEWK